MISERHYAPESPRFEAEAIDIAGNRGPCGGVWRIFKIVDIALEENKLQAKKFNVLPESIFVNWNLVNNIPVVESYEKEGLKNFKNNWDEVSDRSMVLPSAHGVGPDFYLQATAKNCRVIAEGTCQLVTRVQTLARKAEKAGKFIIYIGVDGHPETVGVMNQVSPENICLLPSRSDFSEFDVGDQRPKIVYSQTTLSTKEVAEKYSRLKERWPDIEIPSRWDICNATDTRQAAVRAMIESSDLLVIVGSGPSHNSNELRNIGDEFQKPAYLIDYPNQVDPYWFKAGVKRIGVSSGASVPDYLMQPVVAKILEYNPKAKVCELEQVVDEDLAQVFKYQEEEIREEIRKHYEQKYAA